MTREVFFDIERICLAEKINPRTISLRVGKDACGDTILTMVRTIAAYSGPQVVDVRYPANWWEAVKERFAPRLILRRWPVKYHRERHRAQTLFPCVPFPEDWGRDCFTVWAREQ